MRALLVTLLDWSMEKCGIDQVLLSIIHEYSILVSCYLMDWIEMMIQCRRYKSKKGS